MIEILPQSTETCLAVRFSGKVTGQEYQQFLDAIEGRLKTSDKISLVCELVGFDFYGDFESAKKDFKFGFGEYKHIHRAAFVGDQKWIEWFTRLVGPFTRAEEKHFPADQFEAAFRWASA
jgi:SpoIIAA-like